MNFEAGKKMLKIDVRHINFNYLRNLNHDRENEYIIGIYILKKKPKLFLAL